MVTYKLRHGFSVGAPIAKVAPYLEEMKKKGGDEFTPALVVEDARSPDSPIHPCFTWDDTEAAHKHRLAEARYLMRSYEVHVVSEARHVVVCPGSVRVTTEDKRSVYVSPPAAMTRTDYRDQVLNETRAMLNGLAARLRKLEGLSPIALRLLDKLISEIEADIARKKKAQKPAARASAPTS